MTLTKRQAELLQRLADGEKLSELSVRDRRSKKTIERTLLRARRNLRVHTTMHAVAAAMRKGYIE